MLDTSGYWILCIRKIYHTWENLWANVEPSKNWTTVTEHGNGCKLVSIMMVYFWLPNIANDINLKTWQARSGHPWIQVIRHIFLRDQSWRIWSYQPADLRWWWVLSTSIFLRMDPQLVQREPHASSRNTEPFNYWLGKPLNQRSTGNKPSLNARGNTTSAPTIKMLDFPAKTKNTVYHHSHDQSPWRPWFTRLATTTAPAAQVSVPPRSRRMTQGESLTSD